MLKLFAVLLGGRAKGCNTELHDIVFVVGNSLEETYPQLINKWFGIHKQLHIDASIELTFIDGHEVIINKNKPDSVANKLFCINVGGYKQDYFGEIHEVNFYVASSKPEVLARAKKALGLSLIEPHCDDNILIDDVIEVKNSGDYYIYLLATEKPCKLKIESRYFSLDVPDILEKAAHLRSVNVDEVHCNR
jgi:hypothetical protein